MPTKVMLTARLERELVARINRFARQRNVSVNETISHAMDLAESEFGMAESVADRVGLLEKNQNALYDLIATFGEKMDGKFSEASVNEKERLRSLLTLLKSKIDEHDEAVKERFAEIAVRLPGKSGMF